MRLCAQCREREATHSIIAEPGSQVKAIPVDARSAFICGPCAADQYRERPAQLRMEKGA